MVAKAIVALLSLIMMAACSWWALYWGWGLTVQSWAGVLVPLCASITLYFLMQLAIKSD